MNNEDKIIYEEVRRIAKDKLPVSMSDKNVQETWIDGFINGYLERVIEVLKQNLKK